MNIEEKTLKQVLRAEIYGINKTQLIALSHFLNPIGKGDWYAVSAKVKDDDIEFYGLIHIENKIWGNFTLSELSKMILPFGEKVLIDTNFLPTRISDLL